MTVPKWVMFGTLAHVLGVLVTPFNSVAVVGAVTVYYQLGHQQHLGTATQTADAASYTGAAVYDPTTLNAPPPPNNPPLQSQFGIQLRNGGTPGVSITQSGAFFGFSIEMSVVDQVCEWKSLFSCGEIAEATDFVDA